AGEKQVRRHVAQVPRVKRRNGPLQGSGQLMKLMSRPRQAVQIGVGVLVMGPDGRLVLGMEIATPEDVISHELEERLLEEIVVLAVCAEKERGERIGHAWPGRAFGRLSGRQGPEPCSG